MTLEELRSCGYEVFEFGEFAAWMRGQEMPWAALREFEEFERVFNQYIRRSKTMMKDAVVDYLQKHDIPFSTKNNGVHLVVEGRDCFIDLWPSSGKWKVRNSGPEGFGVRNLVKYILGDTQ